MANPLEGERRLLQREAEFEVARPLRESDTLSLESFTSRLLRDQLADASLTASATPGSVISRRTAGVVLLVDIVGSTSMTDKIAASGPDGAERLGGTLNGYFRRVIETIAREGGDIACFQGDAVIAYWGEDAPSPEAHTLAARAALALRDIQVVWPTEPATPLEHRVTLVSGEFASVLLSAISNRSFHVLAGEPFQTMGAIARCGRPGEVIVDRSVARRLGDCATLRPISGALGEEYGAARLDRLDIPACAPRAIATSSRAPTPLETFLPRIVVQRRESGLAAWIMEFRVVSLVYVRIGGPAAPDLEGADQLRAKFEVVARASEALEVEVFSVAADEKGIVALVVCGLPTFGLESNSSRAVAIAERIRNELSNLKTGYSIGVATGRVFCGVVGNAIRREYVLNGPVMNYGARLMQASDREVLCDRETARAAEGQFTFSPSEEILVKGRADLIPVHRLIDSYGSPALAKPHKGALFGRDSELAQFTDRLERLGSGEGGLIVLEGEPGAGKSRLLQEVSQAALRRDYVVIETCTHAIERATAYFSFRPVLRRLLQESGDHDDVPLSVMRKRLVEALTGSDLLQKASLLEDIMPLGLEDFGLASEITGAGRQAGIEDVLVALLARRITERALVILLDDLHWVDALSADLLRAVSRRLPQVLLVATTRLLDEVEAPHCAGVVRRAALRITVPRLDANSTQRMISAILGAPDVPRRLIEFVYRQSEGLPIHVEQLVLTLLERGLIETKQGACRIVTSDLATAAVPLRLRDIVVDRIDGLSPVDQLVAKVASVIGRVFELDVLRAIYPVPTDARSLDASVRRLAGAGIFEPVSGEFRGYCEFRHVIIQETTYELLSYAQRRPLHRLLVELIENRYADAPEPHYAELAHHCEYADDARRAVDFRLLAASLALRRYANEDALMHVERGESLANRRHVPLSNSQLSQTSFMRGEALHALARFSEAEKQFKTCMRLNGIRRPETQFRMQLSTLGQVAEQAMHRAGLVRRPRDDTMRERARLSAVVHTRLAEHAYFMCKSNELEHDTLCALNQAERVSAASETIGGYGALAIGLGTTRLHMLGRYYRHRAIEMGRQAGSLRDEGFARLYAGVYSQHSGHWRETRTHLQEGSRIFGLLGDRFRMQSCESLQVYVAIATGDYAAGWEILRRFGADAEAVDNLSVRVWMLAEASTLDMIEGRSPADALRRMDMASQWPLHRVERHLCEGLAGAACLRAGDDGRAERIANEALTNMLEAFCTMGSAWNSVCAVAEVFLELLERSRNSGERAEALRKRAGEACGAVSAYAMRTRICRPRARLLEGRLALADGRPRHAAGQFRRALSWARHLAMPLDEALSYLGLAETLGESDARRRHRHEGESMLRAIGARPWGYDWTSASAVAPASETAMAA
jgi:class 3 adenylate cyclase